MYLNVPLAGINFHVHVHIHVVRCTALDYTGKENPCKRYIHIYINDWAIVVFTISIELELGGTPLVMTTSVFHFLFRFFIVVITIIVVSFEELVLLLQQVKVEILFIHLKVGRNAACMYF